MKSKTYRIPFNKDPKGFWHMMEWSSVKEPKVSEPAKQSTDSWVNMYSPLEWRDIATLQADLVLYDWGKGRSSARFRVYDPATEIRYSLTMSAFFDAISLFGCKNKVISGTWTFKKQGANYSLVPCEAVEAPKPEPKPDPVDMCDCTSCVGELPFSHY